MNEPRQPDAPAASERRRGRSRLVSVAVVLTVALVALFAKGLSIDERGGVQVARGCEVHKRVKAHLRIYAALAILGASGDLRRVHSLDLSQCTPGTDLTDLSPLVGLTGLTHLNLEACESLTVFLPLARVPSLRRIYWPGRQPVGLKLLDQLRPDIDIR